MSVSDHFLHTVNASYGQVSVEQACHRYGANRSNAPHVLNRAWSIMEAYLAPENLTTGV